MIFGIVKAGSGKIVGSYFRIRMVSNNLIKWESELFKYNFFKLNFMYF